MARTARVLDVDPATAALLHDLFARAELADGVGAISEAFRLAVGPARDGRRPHPSVCRGRHRRRVCAGRRCRDSAAGTAAAVAELVVDPLHRRQGHGRALLDAVLADGAHSVWAHGLLPAADALARSAGLVMTRSLYRMARPLTAADAVDPVLPAGFSVRAFEPGRDDETWVALNAAAFASHPEQGRLTLEDLHERMAQPWFDPAGLPPRRGRRDRPGRRLPLDQGRAGCTPRPRLSDRRRNAAGAAFRRDLTDEVGEAGGDWRGVRRRCAPGIPGSGAGRTADPAGAGPPRPPRALREVELYVDGDNAAARRTYERLGFVDVAVDGQYTRAGT